MPSRFAAPPGPASLTRVLSGQNSPDLAGSPISSSCTWPLAAGGPDPGELLARLQVLSQAAAQLKEGQESASDQRQPGSRRHEQPSGTAPSQQVDPVMVAPASPVLQPCVQHA